MIFLIINIVKVISKVGVNIDLIIFIIFDGFIVKINIRVKNIIENIIGFILEFIVGNIFIL